jgi:hypothetical protein
MKTTNFRTVEELNLDVNAPAEKRKGSYYLG